MSEIGISPLIHLFIHSFKHLVHDIHRPKNGYKTLRRIPPLGIYPEKTIIQKESCTTVFIAALFTIARTWKQPKCLSTDEWIKKMWCIYTMEYYSAIKRNEIELFVVRLMDLESVIQSEVSQKEKNKYRMITHIYGILKKKKLVLKNLGAGQEYKL